MTVLKATSTLQQLQRLLQIGGWQNRSSAIAEAMPHMADTLSIDEIYQTLENLQVPFSAVACRETDITKAEAPALVLLSDGGCYLLHDVSAAGLSIEAFTGPMQSNTAAGPACRKPTRQKCYILRVERGHAAPVAPRADSVAKAFEALPAMLPWLLAASFLSNLLGLVAPLLIMVIYDRVIPTSSDGLLLSLAIGVCFIAMADFGFRRLRTRALSYVGARSEFSLTLMLFSKLMRLPMAQMDKSNVDQQLSRFRQFEGLRNIFTGQVMTALLDLPFAVVFFAVLYVLAPSVAMLVLGTIVVFLVLAALSVPKQQRLDSAAAKASAELGTAISDAVHKQKALINLGMTSAWHDRVWTLSEFSETSAAEAQDFRGMTQALAQTTVAVTTMMAIILSTYAVLAGDMTFGALIAVIALSSKVLAPFHALFGATSEILSFLQSRQQADRVLSLAEEQELGPRLSHQKTLRGRIDFTGVTYRPDPHNAPVLSQVSFSASAGEVVLVMGSELAGRTAILNLIDGLYDPLAGTIEHDGIDIRQIARDELRRSIAFSTYENALFHGTLDQNFRLAAPDLDDTILRDALQRFGLLHRIEQLPDALATRFTRASQAEFSTAEIKSLCLARSIARPAPICLFSEPTVGLGPDQRAAFKAWVGENGGTRSIFISSSDRSLVTLADRYLFIDSGRLLVNDTGESGRKKLAAAFRKNGS